MKTIVIKDRKYEVNTTLEDFNVNQPTSNSISFFGSNPKTGSLFIQFRNGGTYIYSGITTEIRKQLLNAQSIGSFVAKNIVGKFPSTKIEGFGLKISKY